MGGIEREITAIMQNHRKERETMVSLEEESEGESKLSSNKKE